MLSIAPVDSKHISIEADGDRTNLYVRGAKEVPDACRMRPKGDAVNDSDCFPLRDNFNAA